MKKSDFESIQRGLEEVIRATESFSGKREDKSAFYEHLRNCGMRVHDGIRD